MIINHIIRGCGDWERLLLRIISNLSLIVKVNNLEIVEFGFIEVRQVPIYANIFECEIVPLIVVWIVGNLVVMKVLALSPHSLQLHNFPCVKFMRSAPLVLEFGRNPSTVYYNGSAINSYGIFLCECFFKVKTTALVAVQGVYHIITLLSVSLLVIACGWDQDLL